MMWADFHSPKLLTDDDAHWLAMHYSILSLEKCTGRRDGMKTEDAVYATAAQLKRLNKDVKVLMYWAVDGQGTVDCYRAGQALEGSHPEFHLLDANGSQVPAGSGRRALDYRKEEVRKWWASVPLSSPSAPANVAGLIDGVLADGVGLGQLVNAGLDETVKADWLAGQYKMLDEMQAVFGAANGGLVAGNGIFMDSFSPDHNLEALEHTNGALFEHFAAFESRVKNTGELNKTRVAESIGLVAEVAAKGKVVLVNFWPGPMVEPSEWVGKATPTTNEGRAEALLHYWDFTVAAFLIMVEPTVFFQYAWWYPISNGVMPCANQSQTVHCWGPPHWYDGRHVYQPLGAPLGAAVRDADGAYRWTRSFEHADAVLDLDAPEQSSVEWHAVAMLESDGPDRRSVKRHVDAALHLDAPDGRSVK